MMKVIWTFSRWERAKAMRANGAGNDEIAIALGLTETQVRGKFANKGYSNRSAARQQRVEPNMVERDARKAASDRRTPTQIFFGDPPPGYSALDQKNSANAK